MRKLSTIFLMALCTTACTTKYATNGENLYLKSKNGIRVSVPPPLTSSNISPFYDLPAQTQNAKVSISPPNGVYRDKA